MGNLRTALLSWLFARSTDRGWLIRIEDLDRARDAGTAAQQLADLAAIGLHWDGAPLRQTARVSLYADVLNELLRNGHAYECYCTRRDILSAPSAPHTPEGSYPGTCRELSETERERARARISPRQPSIRIRFDDPHASIMFEDQIAGSYSGEIDDFVIMRGDGAYAYNFVSVIDDALTGVDQVVRGNDLLSSTPRQIALQQLLGFPQPEYVHVPLVLGPQGKRLAKRDGAVTLADLGRHGVSAQRVLGWLGASLRLCRAEEKLTVDELFNRFDPALLPREPWVFDAGAVIG